MPKGKVASAWINSAQADAVAEYYVQGHSVTETAEIFGVPRSQVNNLAKARGLTNGRNFRLSRVEDQKAEAERKLAERVTKIGFEYVGGYTSKTGKVQIRCAICGGMCDWNDRIWNGNCGPTYPSKDHIIPLAKGGTHTWDNMQVAHIICNSEKGASVQLDVV